MLPSPPVSSELKGSTPAAPTDDLTLPAPMLGEPKPGVRKPTRRNHSEIERRRRERLNVKYNELRELVPTCQAFRFARRGGDAGLHKLDILTEAVNYINELQQELERVRSQREPKKAEVTRIAYLMN